MIASLPRPEPSAGLPAYERERLLCLSLDPEKRANFLRYERARGAGRKADVDYLPVKLDIENVSRCNFACTMCVVSTWPKGRRAQDMPLNAYRQLIDEQRGLVEIKLNGLGEALLQGDEYFLMIRYARMFHIWVRITTNASLLHLRENYMKLVDTGVNEIDISIDGADAPTFQGIRVQSDFNRVAENCKLLNAYAAKRGRHFTKMWTLVQKANIHGLQRHVPLAKELGFRHLVFSTQLHGWGHDDMAKANAEKEVALTFEQCQQLVELGKEHGVRVAFWDVSAKFSTDHPSSLCPWPFERAVVTSDLRTVPCCMIGDPDAFEIAPGQQLVKSWTGEEYRAFRQAHLDGKVPGVCKSCYKAEGK